MSDFLTTQSEGFAWDIFINKPTVLVYVSTKTCAPCKRMAPVIAELTAATAVTVLKMDAETDEEVYRHYPDLRGVPTLYLYRHGKLVNNCVGTQTSAQLAEFLTVGLMSEVA